MKTICIILCLLFSVSCIKNVGDSACPVSDSVIKSIGGCDKYGNCGVMLENGKVLKEVKMPVIGSKPYGFYCSELPQ